MAFPQASVGGIACQLPSFWYIIKENGKGDEIMRFASTGTRYVSGVSFTRSGRVRGAGGGNGGSGG